MASPYEANPYVGHYPQVPTPWFPHPPDMDHATAGYPGEGYYGGLQHGLVPQSGRYNPVTPRHDMASAPAPSIPYMGPQPPSMRPAIHRSRSSVHRQNFRRPLMPTIDSDDTDEDLHDDEDNSITLTGESSHSSAVQRTRRDRTGSARIQRHSKRDQKRRRRSPESRNRSPAPQVPLPSKEMLGMNERLAKCETAAKEADARQRDLEERVQETESYLKKKIEDTMRAQEEANKRIQMAREAEQAARTMAEEAEQNSGEGRRKAMEERAVLEMDMRMRFDAEETARREARESEARAEIEMMKRAWEQLLHDIKTDMNRVKEQQLAGNVLRDEIRAGLQVEATKPPKIAEEASLSPIPSYSPESPYFQCPDLSTSPPTTERTRPLEPRRRRVQELPPEAPDPPTEEVDEEVELDVDQGTGAESSIESSIGLASSYYSTFRSESRSSWRGGRDWRAEREARRSLRIFREEIIDPICDTLLSLLDAYTPGGRPMDVPSFHPQPPHSSIRAHKVESVPSGSDPQSYLSGFGMENAETVTPGGNRQFSPGRQALRRPGSRTSNRANETHLQRGESPRACSLERFDSLTESGHPGLVKQEPTGIEEVAHELETPDPADLAIASNIKRLPRTEVAKRFRLMSSPTLPDAVYGEEAIPPAYPSPEVAFGLSDEENSDPTFKMPPMSSQKRADMEPHTSGASDIKTSSTANRPTLSLGVIASGGPECSCRNSTSSESPKPTNQWPRCELTDSYLPRIGLQVEIQRYLPREISVLSRGHQVLYLLLTAAILVSMLWLVSRLLCSASLRGTY